MPPKATPKPTDDEPTVARQVIPATATEEREDVKLTRTGWAHFTFAADTYRLRRPMFGELKRLRLRLEDLSDEIDDRSVDTAVIGDTLKAERVELAEQAASGDRPADWSKRRAANRLKDREAGRALSQFTESQMVVWWADVFAVLCVDKTTPDFTDEDALPAWLTDPSLPNQVMQHWRSAPLARG